MQPAKKPKVTCHSGDDLLQWENYVPTLNTNSNYADSFVFQRSSHTLL